MRLTSAVLLAGAAVGVGSLVEPLFPVLRSAEVAVLPAGARPIRVLHVSDLHLLPRHGRRSRWIQELAGLAPDVVVATGDLWSSARALPILGGQCRGCWNLAERYGP